MRLATRSLAEGGVLPNQPISEEGLTDTDRYLPECSFRDRDNRESRYFVLAAAVTHAGVEVDCGPRWRTG